MLYVVSLGMCCYCSSSQSFFQLLITFIRLYDSQHSEESAQPLHSQQVENECLKLCLLCPSRFLSLLIIFSEDIHWLPKWKLLHRRMWLLKYNQWIINVWKSNFHYTCLILFKIPKYLFDLRSFARPLILMYSSIFFWGESVDTLKCSVYPLLNT